MHPASESRAAELTAPCELTACSVVCRIMGPEHALVAKQWDNTRHPDDDEHFFAVLDFADGQEIYQRVRTPPPAY